MHETYLEKAIQLSKQAVETNQGGPFGAVIVKGGEIIGEGCNCVTSTNDPTAHAEVTAIRKACETVGEFSLEGAILYSSCEPCPMCLSAAYWARLSAIYYANTKAQAADIGFDDQLFYREIVMPLDKRSTKMVHMPAESALEAFQLWEKKDDKIRY